MAYNFLKNVEKHIKEKEDTTKKEILGNIVSSLQQPVKDVINLMAGKEDKQLEAGEENIEDNQTTEE